MIGTARFRYLLVFTLTTYNLCTTHTIGQSFDGIYCGRENCYDVLGADRETTTKEELARLYRNLARRWHPDRFISDSEKRALATEKFRQIATAYEVLRDEAARRDYNDVLDDPEQYYRHYYRYYKRVYGAKVDAHWVILGLITGLSMFQYFAMHLRYKQVVDEFLSMPKYRFKAQVLAKQQRLLPICCDTSSTRGGVVKRSQRQQNRSKEEIRKQEEAVIRRVIEDNLDGAFVRPDIRQTLWIQILLLPVSLYEYIYWQLRWLYLFRLRGKPLGYEEKIYLLSRLLKISQQQLEASEYDLNSMLKQELWMEEKFLEWKHQRDQAMRERMAESSSYKRYRRYMKRGGPGQITFLDSD